MRITRDQAEAVLRDYYLNGANVADAARAAGIGATSASDIIECKGRFERFKELRNQILEELEG